MYQPFLPQIPIFERALALVQTDRRARRFPVVDKYRRLIGLFPIGHLSPQKNVRASWLLVRNAALGSKQRTGTTLAQRLSGLVVFFIVLNTLVQNERAKLAPASDSF